MVVQKAYRFVTYETKLGKKHRILAPGFYFNAANVSPEQSYGSVLNSGMKGLKWNDVAYIDVNVYLQKLNYTIPM